MRTIEITPEMIADMTVGEIEVIEQRTGRPITAMFTDDAPRGVVLHAIAHVVQVREARESHQPDPAWEDTGNVKVVLAADQEGATGTANPTPASSRRARRAG